MAIASLSRPSVDWTLDLVGAVKVAQGHGHLGQVAVGGVAAGPFCEGKPGGTEMRQTPSIK